MAVVKIQDLVAAGVHFGHRVSRWNPKMERFIYGKKSLIHILDLRETVRGLVKATDFLAKLASTGREVVFVSTKRQARTTIRREAERCGMHWVTERWLGGTLTNHSTVRKRLKRLEFLERVEATGEIESYSKKMISSLRRERRKILRNLEGIRNMKHIPGALVVVDVNRERIAVREANKLGTVVIGIVDTDCDPDGVDIPIPGNDDAFRAVEAIVRPLADAVIEGRDKLGQAEGMRTEGEAEQPVGAGAAPPGEGEPPVQTGATEKTSASSEQAPSGPSTQEGEPE